MLDLKITGGEIHDGRGHKPLRADLGIKGDRITQIGDLSEASAARVADASGRFVCPGFIDVHSHSDAYLFIEPAAPNKIYQGVTTEIVGNCGASAAPLMGEYKMPADWQEQEYPFTWCSVADYGGRIDEVGPAPNVALLVGHNSLRAGVMGYEARSATEDEMRGMERLLEQSLEEGAIGLSTGLIYTPGRFAPPEEVFRLAEITARHGGIYTSHMRSEGERLIESIDETLAVGKHSGARVQVSHLKAAGRQNWHLLDKALGMLRQVRDEGLPVAADRYPYTAGCTDLDVIFPDWALEGGRAAELSRLKDRETCRRIGDEIRAAYQAESWKEVWIGSTHHPDNAKFRGKPLLEVALELDMDPVDTALHLIEADELLTGAIFFSMNEENMWRILGEPYVMIGSDGSIRSLDGPLSHDHPHPRTYGTFARYLRAVLDGATVSLPEAIRKMTSLPAEQFNLKDRGLLAPGKAADIVIFGGNIRDKATYADPHQLSEGIDAVIVNGVLTLEDGHLTGLRGGRFLA